MAILQHANLSDGILKVRSIMKHSLEQKSTAAMVLLMGATGTGKSSLINLVTNDDRIRVGHNQQSETFGLQTARYVDQATGRSVVLIDTPGFDDSRENVTDTDLLEKIVQFLDPESGERINVTAIIYMHRISDPRVSSVSRKNLRMFYALCGKENLANVRIVTTNWSRVTEEEGNYREADLKNGAFKALVDAGAQMRRHTNTFESALQILSELIHLQPMTLSIQEEVRAGKTLMNTSAGQVLAAEMQAMKKKHERELVDLEKEMNDAEEEKNRALIAELEQEREVLQEKMRRANADRKKLEFTLRAVQAPATGEQGSSMTLRKGNEDPFGESKTIGARLKDPLRPEHRSANRSSELSQDLLRDVTGRVDPPQLQRIDSLGTSWYASHHQSQVAERHLTEMEYDLQELHARIRHAEKKRDRWARMSRKLNEGANWLAGEIVGTFFPGMVENHSQSAYHA